jgi:hypothetical protein
VYVEALDEVGRHRLRERGKLGPRRLESTSSIATAEWRNIA